MGAGLRSKARVALLDTGPDLLADVARVMEAADWRSAIPEGAAIALKPNLGFDHLLPGAITSPLVVEGVVRVLRERASKIYLVEADQVVVDIEVSFRRAGMDRICRQYGLEWVNLSRQPIARVPVPGALEVPEIPLPEILTRTTLVTVPVMKTHNKTGLSGAIKNQWGCLPTFRHNYHPVVHEVLCDLMKVLRPAFAVLDATVALEGDGPKSGIPRVCNLLMASSDPVAIDAVSAQVMGMDPRTIRHLELCAAAGIGVRDLERIEVVGADGAPRREVPRFDFIRAKHNTVSFVEQLLRQTFFRRLFFETPLLWPLCWAARGWYSSWYHLFGGKQRFDDARRASPYGGQWQ
ncbi:MAG: DUF362 domain-containing protein [Candidatus Eisenbacteria bacterium]